jgi:sirohydrochlorin cobaltochelatase
MAHDDHPRPAAVILVGGHESDGGRALPPAADLRAPESRSVAVVTVTAAGRDLERTLARVLRTREPGQPVVVVPMTLGRDPRLVSDTARTVRWAGRGADAGALALAPPFGTADHLIGHLRTACRRLGDDRAAILITAAAADPFDDAELYRVAALVWTHSPHAIVEVGLRRPGSGLEVGLERCRRLGASRIAVVPADFGVPDGADGPLLSVPAIASIVAARVDTALHRLTQHGDDGVAAAHDADHHHGFAHSHGDAEHHHSHPHSHAHDHLAVG